MSDETEAANPDEPEAAAPDPPAAADEAPTEPVATPTSADEAPTEAAAPPAEASETAESAEAVGAAASPAAAASAVPADTSTRERGRGRGVFVPAWVAIVVGVLLIAGLGFAIGWIAAPGDDSDSVNASASQTVPDQRPQLPGNSGNTPDDDNGNGRNPQGSDDGDDGNDGQDLPILPGAFLGVSVETAANDGGAVVTSVADGSPAADAGLTAGDVITAIDGEDVNSALDLVRQIRTHEPDDSVTITYTRNGTSAEVKVELESRSTPQSVR